MQVTIVISFALAATATSENEDKVVSLPIDTRAHKTRIINGEEAVPHSIPWQAGLNFETAFGEDWFCGGSIIHNEWILTAAHCTDDATLVKVILGAHNLEEEEPTQIRVVSKEFISHEDFDQATLLNDIALIKLPKPVEFNDNIQPIGLNSETNVDGLEVTVSGWGKIADNLHQLTDILRTITVTVMPNSKCRKYYSSTLHSSIDDTKLCINTGAKVGKVDGGGKSTCTGDSGGPMVLIGTTQVGIDSFGTNICELGFPGVFTRISSHIEWINTKIATF